MSRAAAAVVLVFLVIFSIGAPFVIGAAIEDSKATYQPRHEFTPEPGTTYSFDESEIDGATYFDNETVRHDNGTVAEEGVEYEWHTSNGTLTVLDGGDLHEDSNASITFTYNGQTSRQAAVSDIPVRANQIIVPLALIGAVGMMGAALVVLKGVA